MPNMRSIIAFWGTMAAAAALLAGCNAGDDRYSGPEYIMFADTMSVNVVLQDRESFTVPVVSTVTCDYDRTIGVEIIDRGSSAIEGRDFSLASNTLTIKAGENRADVVVNAMLDNLSDMDTLQFNLRLVVPDAVRWDLYGDQTKVRMFKVQPFDIDNFTGWCMVTSSLLLELPGMDNSSVQRLIWTRKGTEENTVVLTNWLHDGYDVTIRLDPSDPAVPAVTMDPDQVISNEQYVLGQINADDKIYVEESSAADSYYNTCRNSVLLNTRVYLLDFGQPFATLGYYDHAMEWVTDEEANRLVIEDGMVKRGGPTAEELGTGNI